MAFMIILVALGAVLPFYLAKRWAKWWLALASVPLGIVAAVALGAACAVILHWQDPSMFPVGYLFGKVVGYSTWSIIVSPIAAFIGWRKAGKVVGSTNVAG